MLNFFKSILSRKKTGSPPMLDLDKNPISEGQVIDVLRYDMGKSKVINTEKGLAYQSLETGKVVTWHYMVDAATGLQKVKKLSE